MPRRRCQGYGSEAPHTDRRVERSRPVTPVDICMIRYFTVLIVILAVTLVGCSPNDDDFRDRLFSEPRGIVETDENGDVINWPDWDMDWETSPRYAGVLVFDPAYPNPARPSTTLRIPVTVRTSDFRGGLYIDWIRDGLLNRIADYPFVDEPGYFILELDAALFGTTGLFRIFITDVRGDVVSYGDIRIE